MSVPSPDSSTDAVFGAANYVEAVNNALASYLEQQLERIAGIAQESLDLASSIATLTTGGKRVRPLFAWHGWQVAGGDPRSETIIKIGVALELFQAAALIHDDVLDRSDTRRNQPSVHRRFEALHRERLWDQDPEHFGISSAILAGDLSLALSEEVISSVVQQLNAETFDRAVNTRRIFDQMRFEVMTGQYLDIREEAAGSSHSPEVALDRAMTILQFKSAKYSIQRPLMLGAAAAGANAALLEQLANIGLPLGEAFQLRDDQLGVFGDPSITGKPSGDDLREGKRTALIAFAREKANPQQSALIQDYLGVPHLSEDQIIEFQQVIQGTGASDKVEMLITERATIGLQYIAELNCSQQIKNELSVLARKTIDRRS